MSSTTPGPGSDDEMRGDEAIEPEASAEPNSGVESPVADDDRPAPADDGAEEPGEPAAATSATPAETTGSAVDDGGDAATVADPIEPDATTPASFDEPEREPLDEPESAEASETSALDAAVLRANARAEASAPVDGEPNGIDDAEAAPQPVPAGSVRRETFVPASTAAVAAASGAATLSPETVAEPTTPFGAQTVYVQAPDQPRAQGNRAFGALVALIGAALFAALYAAVAYLLLLSQGDAAEVNTVFLERFLAKPVYWVPIVAFFVGFALLAAIVNRGRWWAYVVFGLLVGVFVYFSYLGGALLTVEAWTLTFDEAQTFIAQRWLDPFAIVAGVIAREIPIWLGGWIAARGRTVTERNRLALEAYDRELAAGPRPQSLG
ncbi:hypothetical protein [Agromyces italicus]|uniref:hypothetical protein n=1 Tax=Agromyces italicus TaxID=279572 RepID=UPI000411BA27|nr:hypothetical protein [Agromyces italicus]